MKVIFKTTKLQDSFDKPKIRQKVYGEYSKNIKMRYDLLLAANSLGDISHNPPPKRHSLKGELKGIYSVTVKGPVRILLKPIVSNGQNDLSAQKIIILEVLDYH